MDSDAFFLDSTMSIPELLSTHVPTDALTSDRTIFFGGNAPYNATRPCTGVFFVKNTRLARELLLDWWNRDFKSEKFFDQYALHDALYDNPSKRIQDGVFTAESLQFFANRTSLPIRHIWFKDEQVTFIFAIIPQ